MSELIHPAMLSIMSGIGAITKDKQVTFGGNYKYRGIDQVYAAVHPLMVTHGVYMTSEILERHREERETNNKGAMIYTQLRMRYWFRAADGSSVATEVEGEGMDVGDKSSNKAMAVAHKYAILQAFCVPTEEFEDPDKEKHEIKAVSSMAKSVSNPKPAPAQPAPALLATPSVKSDSDGTTQVRVLAVDRRADKNGRPYYALNTQEILSSGKSLAFCRSPHLFDAMLKTKGEDCLVVFDTKQPAFPTILDVKLIGEERYMDGRSFHDDIPF